jgi:hypothetical protein
MKKKIDLSPTCDHDICDCIVKAIEDQVLPAAYNEGYIDGYRDIISELPSIIRQAGEAMNAGVSPERWAAALGQKIMGKIERVKIGYDIEESAKHSPDKRKALVN